MFHEFEFFQPVDFLELSKELFANFEDFESGISSAKRTIYNRIYFSAFLHVREWLVLNQNYMSTVNDHSSIPDFIRFNGPFDTSKNLEIASDLELLKKLRHQADYYISRDDCMRYNASFLDKDIDEALKIAEKIFNSFQ